MQSIGWIGVGIMGGPMVRNLLKAGFEVHITARNRAKVEEVIQAGAVFHDTIAGCVQGRQAVVTMRRSTLPRGTFWTRRRRGPTSST